MRLTTEREKILKSKLKKFNYQPYFQSNGIQINSLLVYNSDTDFKLLQNAIYYFDFGIEKAIALLKMPSDNELEQTTAFQHSLIQIISSFEVYCRYKLIELVDDRGLINIDAVLKKFMPRNEIESKKLKIDELCKQTDKNKIDAFFTLTRINLQNLQTINTLFKLIFNVNICHDLGLSSEYNRISEILDKRHLNVHTILSIIYPSLGVSEKVDVDYICNCIVIFVKLVHTLDKHTPSGRVPAQL